MSEKQLLKLDEKVRRMHLTKKHKSLNLTIKRFSVSFYYGTLHLQIQQSFRRHLSEIKMQIRVRRIGLAKTFYISFFLVN